LKTEVASEDAQKTASNSVFLKACAKVGGKVIHMEKEKKKIELQTLRKI